LKEGICFIEMFPLLAKLEVLRILLALAVYKNIKLYKIYEKNCFSK